MNGLVAILYRESIIRMTSPLWLFFDLMVPVLYLLMFGVGFNAALSSGIEMGGQMYTYNEFFVAGVIGMACFGLAMNQSYGFFVDRENGIFYETLTYPITRGEFLLGKILFQLILAIIQTVFTLAAAAYLLGVNIPLDTMHWLVGGVILGTMGWFFSFAAVAFRIRRNDTFNTIVNVAYFVLLFVSSMFYPLENLPSSFRFVSYLNPITWHTDVLRWALLGAGDPSTIVLEAFAFLVFTAIAFRIALRSLDRALE